MRKASRLPAFIICGKVIPLAILLLSFLGNYANAQIDVVGHIYTGPARQPIESAYVALVDASDSLLVAFDRTKRDGSFTLRYKAVTQRAFFIKVSHINYQTLLRSLPAQRTIDLYMEPANLVLNEVQVTARIPVREQGDSTRYKVDSFRSGAEPSLEEVLKKMPNIRVEDNGDIYFKNKKIDKVFIDGDDLVGNTYQLATRSINPAVLSEVQAIENFSDNKLLRKIEQGQQTVLNLTVKNDRKSLLFGMLDVAAGPERHNGVGNLFSYSKRVKAFAVLSANNTGTRRLDLSDADATVLADERPQTDLLIKPFTRTAQPFSRNLNSPLENLNNERVATLNLSINPAKALKITANFSLLRDHIQAGQYQTNQLIGAVPTTYKQADTLQQKPALAHAHIQANYDFSTRTALLYRGVVGTKTIELNQATTFSSEGQVSQFPQRFANRIDDYWHTLELTHKLTEKQALVLSGQTSRTQLNEQFTTRLTPLLWATIFFDSLPNPTAFHQQVNQTNQLVSGQVRWLYGTKNRKLEQQVGYQLNRFDAQVHQQDTTSAIAHETLRMDRSTLYSRTAGKLIWPDLEMSGYLQFSQLRTILNNQTESRTPIQASLTLSYRMGRLSRLAIGYEHQASLVSNSYLIEQAVITDYRSAQQGHPGLLLDMRDQLTLSYMFTDVAYRRMALMASLFATQSNSFWNLSDLRFTPDYNLLRLINTPKVYTLGGNGTLEKLIYPISGNIRLIVNVISSQGTQLVNGTPRTTNTLMPTITAKYVSVFESPFNMEVGMNYRHTSVQVAQADQTFEQTFTQLNSYMQFSFRNKGYQMSLTADGNKIQHNTYLFLRANATYVLSSTLSIRLDAMNLLNQTAYSQIAVTPTTYSVVTYPLLSRMVLAAIRYAF